MIYTFSDKFVDKINCLLFNTIYNLKHFLARFEWKRKHQYVKCIICGNKLDSLESEYSPIDCGWHQLIDYTPRWICHSCADHINFLPYMDEIRERDRLAWEKILNKNKEV